MTGWSSYRSRGMESSMGGFSQRSTNKNQIEKTQKLNRSSVCIGSKSWKWKNKLWQILRIKPVKFISNHIFYTHQNDSRKQVLLMKSLYDPMMILSHIRTPTQHERCPPEGPPSLIEPLPLQILNLSPNLAASLVVIHKLYALDNLILVFLNIPLGTRVTNFVKLRIRYPTEIFLEVLT